MERRASLRCASRIAVLFFILALAGCSKKQTSPSVLCDNEGSDLIAFASDRGHPNSYDIYLYDADQGGFRLLRDLNSAAASDSNPSLSRDGQLIAFVSDRGSAATHGIYVYERLSCSLLDTPILHTGTESEPTFSGDTRRLAFVRDTAGHRRIRLVNGGSLTFVPLPGLEAPAPYDDWSPAPDSTGDRIVFVSDREGAPQLYLYDRNARTVDSLLDLRSPGARDLDPSLTPDARYLSFASDRSGGQGGLDVYLVDLTTSPISYRTLTGVNTAGDERHPRLNHSGGTLAFQSLSPDSTGWNVRYYGVHQNYLFKPSQLSGTGADIQPSVRVP